MKSSTKIWLAITGILLVALGIVCICHPAGTLFATAWTIGCFTLFAGISKLVFTCKTQAFLPNSGTRMLSSILEILVGIIFLGNNLFLAVSLPVIFVMWILIEGILIAVQSFDYKQAGFSNWWCILILGIVAAILGVLGLKNPDTSAKALSTLIGLAIIMDGLAHLIALRGIGKFEKKVDQVRKALGVDEQ